MSNEKANVKMDKAVEYVMGLIKAQRVAGYSVRDYKDWISLNIEFKTSMSLFEANILFEETKEAFRNIGFEFTAYDVHLSFKNVSFELRF